MVRTFGAAAFNVGRTCGAAPINAARTFGTPPINAARTFGTPPIRCVRTFGTPPSSGIRTFGTPPFRWVRTSSALIEAKGGKMDKTKGIGGSDVAAICGVSPWKTPLQIYLEKIGVSAEMLG